MQITRSRDQDHPGQPGETLSLQKIKTFTRHGGGCLWFYVLRRLRQEDCLSPGVEAAVSYDCTTAPQPGQQKETPSLQKYVGAVVELRVMRRLMGIPMGCLYLPVFGEKADA